MKILQINKFFYLMGGGERYFFEVSKLLKNHGHEVIFFSMKHKKNNFSEYEKYFVDYLDFTKIKLSFSNFQPAGRAFYSLEARKKINKLIKETKPDVAHIHNIDHQISPSILHVLKKHKIPVVMTLHHYKLICPNYYLFNNRVCEKCKKYKYYNCILNKCIKNSYLASLLVCLEMYFHKALKIYKKNVDIFISPSQFMKDKCVEFGIDAKKIIVLPHFVNSELGIRNQELGIRDQKYILYFGRLAKEKGVDILLEAMKHIKHQVRLKIVGDGPEKNNYQLSIINYQLNNVDFLGHLEGRGLEKVITEAMFIVVPSIGNEVFGLVILESFALGKPVIASKIGGIPEVINDHKTGLLFNPGDAKDLAQKINWLIERPEKIKKMGQAGFIAAQTKFSAEMHYKKLMEIYHNFI
ncbi:MAG: glycosyltransferase family 4 protein [Patescibacteria group bacterium]